MNKQIEIGGVLAFTSIILGAMATFTICYIFG
jgi:hypothetical protein